MRKTIVFLKNNLYLRRFLFFFFFFSNFESVIIYTLLSNDCCLSRYTLCSQVDRFTSDSFHFRYHCKARIISLLIQNIFTLFWTDIVRYYQQIRGQQIKIKSYRKVSIELKFFVKGEKCKLNFGQMSPTWVFIVKWGAAHSAPVNRTSTQISCASLPRVKLGSANRSCIFSTFCFFVHHPDPLPPIVSIRYRLTRRENGFSKADPNRARTFENFRTQRAPTFAEGEDDE